MSAPPRTNPETAAVPPAMNLAPTMAPSGYPIEAPTPQKVDMVPRIDSGTRSDSTAMAGASIMLRPTMHRQ